VVRQRETPGQAPQTILIPEELILRESTAGVSAVKPMRSAE